MARERTVYIVGHNMPGYLPDSDNYIVGTKRAAIAASWAEAKQARDSCIDGAADPEHVDVHLTGRQGDYWLSGEDCTDEHYWVNPAAAERAYIASAEGDWASGERCACCERKIGGPHMTDTEPCWYVSLAEAYVCDDCL